MEKAITRSLVQANQLRLNAGDAQMTEVSSILSFPR